jgi:hypothetical protein
VSNPPVDPDTGEIQVRPFADVLRDLGRGAVIDEAAVLLQDLVRAVRDYGKKGTFTLKVEVQPMKGDARALMVTAKADAKPPAGEPVSGVFFTDDVGNLVQNDPRQPQLPLRELNRENKELRQA